MDLSYITSELVNKVLSELEIMNWKSLNLLKKFNRMNHVFYKSNATFHYKKYNVTTLLVILTVKSLQM